MGWFSKIKEKVEGNLAKGSESVPGKIGQAIGGGVARVGGAIKERYNRKYGGGEYREARTKDYEARAKETSAKAKLFKAKREARAQRGNAFRSAFGLDQKAGNAKNYTFITGERSNNNYDFLTGARKKKSGDFSFITGKK